MSSPSLVEIEEILRTADPQKRHQTLRAVADLFLSSAPDLDEQKVDLFDHVFGLILDDADRSEVESVSQRMAPVENAPRKLIRRLANDREITVAGPVLSQSPRLSEQDLCEIARSKGNAHMLAIAARKQLSAPVTDILIDRGNEDVAQTVANNVSAKLSEYGVKELLKRAETDDVIGAGLCGRTDIAPELLNTALRQASQRAEEKSKKVAAAQRQVISLQQSKELGEAEIISFATAEKYEELISALALLLNMKFAFVENMMQPKRLAGTVLACKALGFAWTTVDLVLKLANARNQIDPEEVRQAHRDFVNVSRQTAQRIVRFWHARQSISAI